MYTMDAGNEMFSAKDLEKLCITSTVAINSLISKKAVRGSLVHTR